MGSLDVITVGNHHPFKGWEEINITEVPHWAIKRFRGWIPLSNWEEVRGRHYFYRHWNDPANVKQQGDNGIDRYFKRKRE